MVKLYLHMYGCKMWQIIYSVFFIKETTLEFPLETSDSSIIILI